MCQPGLSTESPYNMSSADQGKEVILAGFCCMRGGWQIVLRPRMEGEPGGEGGLLGEGMGMGCGWGRHRWLGVHTIHRLRRGAHP
jgi:hypothetical protein